MEASRHRFDVEGVSHVLTYTRAKMRYQCMRGRSLDRKPAHRLAIRRIGRPLGVKRIARELRRQERTSDFTGYTENFTLQDLQDFLRLVGGTRWELSAVPISCIKCWQTSAALKEIYGALGPGAERLVLKKQIRRLAEKIRQGRTVPGIFLTKSQQGRGTHWILDGHRRLLAHRVAGASTVLTYYPLGMFSGDAKREPPFAEAN